jgi:hypothetical protein
MLRTIAVCLLVLAACGGKKDEAKPGSPGSAAAVPATANAADPRVTAFWKWFVGKADVLRSDPKLENTMNAISDELRKIDSGVFAEIGNDGEHLVLVISADGDKKKFPTVQRIYDARPTSVPGWRVVAFRQRWTDDDPPRELDVEGKKLDPKQAKFVADPSGSDKLDITLYVPVEGDPMLLARAGFIMLDHTLGEYDMEMRIGGVDFAHVSKAPADAKPLSALPAMVDALKAR